MTKRSLKIAQESVKESIKKNALVNTPSRSRDQHTQEETTISQIEVEESARQLFSTEDQAIEFLVENIVAKLGDNAQDKAEMTEFLNLILDTDPTLKEEILSGVSIRKES